jgi:hypothetical protein
VKNYKPKNYKAGLFNEDVIRLRPTPERINNFMNEMGPTMSDYNVHLWGSWPEKKGTWDLDLLLQNDNPLINTEEMQDIILKGLNSSLVNNNFLADVGFSNKKVIPFKDFMHKFERTGSFTPHSGYVYGPQWYVNNKLWKDRTKYKNGTVIPKEDNMLEVITRMPYHKMLEGSNYEDYYQNKPILIKERKKIYG